MDLIDRLYSYYKDYRFGKGYIGFTEKGYPIPYFCVNKTQYPVIICQYAIHAREYITTELCIKQIEDFILRGKFGTIYFIPAVNIDGIKIALSEKPLYKANARGVDLNVNFDAKWGSGALNKKCKGDENYIGPYPFSESETKSLRDFTLMVMPDATVSYHAKGEEIYWDFFQDEKERDRDYSLALILKRATGYSIKSNLPSAGGYKDWCIEKLKIPAFTIEVGSDDLTHPISAYNLDSIFYKNKNVLNFLTEELAEGKWKKNT